MCWAELAYIDVAGRDRETKMRREKKLTPCSRVLLQKLTVPHLVKKISASYEIRMFPRAHHLFPS